MERDEQLEAAIDRVGRDRVFGRAGAYGWGSGDAPPKWVWWGIVHELDGATNQSVNRLPKQSCGGYPSTKADSGLSRLFGLLPLGI